MTLVILAIVIPVLFAVVVAWLLRRECPRCAERKTPIYDQMVASGKYSAVER